MSKLKPMLGLAAGVLFKVELSRGPHFTHRVRNAKIKEHNAGLSAPKVAWVEQNTEQKAKPSTHCQVYRCVNNNNRYCDIPTPRSDMDQSSSSPATNNAIRGAEQAGNIDKQWFCWEGVKG